MSTARWEWGSIAAITLAFVAVLVALARQTGITVDEPSHLLSSHLYWQGRDVLEPGDMPPLIKIAGGWVPLMSQLPTPAPGHPAWRTHHEWNVALQMMDEMKDPVTRRIFFWARLPLLVFPVASMLLLWWWARRLFGPFGGLMAALVFALSPMVLGHGALFKNDLAATFGYLAFWYSAWRYWLSPGLSRAVWLGVALLAALLAKFSMLVLVPMAIVLVMARAWRTSGFRLASASVAALVLVVYLGVIAAWQFRIEPVPAERVAEWKHAASVPLWLKPVVRVALLVPAPPRFWSGAMSLVQSNAETGPVYLLERLYDRGHPLYFAVAMAVKIPAASQLLILGGLLLFAGGLVRGRAAAADLFWAGPGFLYLTLASLSNLQLGLRLVLPAFPFFILFAGLLARRVEQSRAAAWTCLVLVVWLACRTAVVFPHYIGYFNAWAGGPEHGLHYLSDSNIDWGQDLPSLERVVRSHRIARLRLAYFGTDNPYAYFTDKTVETIVPPWGEHARAERFIPSPGYYAVSATLLTGQYFAPRFRDYFAVFRDMPPVAKAGSSIFVYRIR